ncbi:hypothetical protein AB9K41_26030 [Cribrihabitans sp. XS_ASV171]
MPNAYADIDFTPRVHEKQRRFGSVAAYAHVLSPEREDEIARLCDRIATLERELAGKTSFERELSD